MPTATPQDDLSVAKNKSFFAQNTTYADRVQRLETYRNTRAVINGAINGSNRLLDVGNGGVFDYDTNLARTVVGVDLFLDDLEPLALPPNVTLMNGDALALGQPAEAFDTVLCVMLLHHLVSADVAGTVENIRRSIRESKRVLAPGGRLVIVESCVSRRFFALEKRLFPLLRSLAATRWMDHPPTLQFPPETIQGLLRELFADVEVTSIPVGRFILQFGHVWPTALTPARPYLFVAR